MAEYKDCYIAFLDILGFKGLIGNPDTSCDSIYEIFQGMQIPVSTFEQTVAGLGMIENETLNGLKMQVMSDSICFSLEKNQPNALVYLIQICEWFQADLFYTHSILLRGAISCGKVFSDGNIIFGPGLVSAYLMQENNAKYPRIIITGDLLKNAQSESAVLLGDVLLNKLVFRDFDGFYTLNYFRTLYITCTEEEYKSQQNTIDAMLNKTTDDSIRKKYLYLERNFKEDWGETHNE